MRHILILCILFLLAACQDQTAPGPEAEAAGVPGELPYQSLALNDLSAFRSVAKNWSVAGQVLSDHTEEHDLQTSAGAGVLVNQPTEDVRDNLFTTWEHGDMELKLDFMMPKGSNSGIYFQGRYEIQLFDSWQVEEPKHSDAGGIYQRWDESKPEGERGYDGHAPRLNAAKAPGLWQHLYVAFRAPRFDAAGNKIENARFEKVVLNGVTLHEDVELTGPTRAAAFDDETARAPLMIQGDHGPVAFRNIRYKRYFDERLVLDDIRYQYYEIEGPITQLPDFDTLEMVREGETDSLVFEKLSERQERVAYIFTGTLRAPAEGDYLFTVYSDDGSQLFLNGEMIVDNDGKHDFEPMTGKIHLTEGEHDFKLTYFNNTWGKGLLVQYEGPGMRWQPLYGRLPERAEADRPAMLVEPKAAPEMVRSFVMHEGEKITHAISVGDPKGVHYSVDLRRGALLKFWRGNFADVTEMWYQRGQPQLLHPLEMAVETEDAAVAALLDNMNAAFPEEQPDYLKLRGYDINEAEEPIFKYQVDAATVFDHYQPSADGQELVRTIRAENAPENLYTRIAVADYVEAVGNGYYSVGGKYYLRLQSPAEEPLIRRGEEQTELLFPLTASANEVKYSILW